MTACAEVELVVLVALAGPVALLVDSAFVADMPVAPAYNHFLGTAPWWAHTLA